MLFQTVIGNENWPQGQTKLNLFVVPTTLHSLGNRQETHLWMMAKRPEGGGNPRIGAVGAPNVIPAGAGMRMEMTGKWTECVYDMPEGVIVKAHLVRSGGSGGQEVSCILFRFRDAAPLNRVAISPLPNARATKNQLVLEGKFDILDLAEATALGYAPAPMYIPMFNRHRWGRLSYIAVTEVQKATAVVPTKVATTVRNSQGEDVRIVSDHRKRALDL